jgi:hypothetical protein
MLAQKFDLPKQRPPFRKCVLWEIDIFDGKGCSDAG